MYWYAGEPSYQYNENIAHVPGRCFVPEYRTFIHISCADKTCRYVRLLLSLLLFFCLFHPFSYLRPSFSFPPAAVVTQIRGHMQALVPPSPLRYVPCSFIARRFQLFPSSSTRVELRLPTLRVGARSWSFFPFFYANKFEISPRRDSNSRINTMNSSIRGLPSRRKRW